MLGALPGPPKPNTRAGAPIQVSKGQISSSGVKVAGVTQAAVQTIEANRGTGAAGGDFKVGGGGKSYSTKGQAGGAGARGVKGAVVGAPNLAANVGSEQGLSNEQVMLIVNKHLGEVQRCYERALFEDGSLVGRVEYEWEISASGSVTSARVSRNEIARGDGLNNCVLALFRRLKFPPAKNKQTTVAKIGFPFGK